MAHLLLELILVTLINCNITQKWVGHIIFFFLKTLFSCVNIFQPVGDDTEDCRIELEPRSGVLEPREEKSITVHFIANRTVGVQVMERSTTMTLLLNLDVSKSEYDQEIPQSHTADLPRHHEEEPQNIYSNNTSVRQ